MNAAIFFGFKNVSIGLIHSIFLGHDKVQYVLLILVKVIILSLIFFNKNLFNNKALRGLNIVYILSAIIIDLMLLLSKL